MNTEFRNRILPSILKTTDDNFTIHRKYRLKHAFERDACSALFKSIFQQNGYYLSPKDLAMAISIDSMAYRKGIDNRQILDASLHLAAEIKAIIEMDLNLNKLFQAVGKDISDWDLTIDKNLMLNILDDKKLIFINYFERFSKPDFSSSLHVFFSEYNENCVYYDRKNSVTINVNLAKLPEGILLPFFNYISSKHGTLTKASEYKGKTYFNQIVDGGKVVWIN